MSQNVKNPVTVTNLLGGGGASGGGEGGFQTPRRGFGLFLLKEPGSEARLVELGYFHYTKSSVTDRFGVMRNL